MIPKPWCKSCHTKDLGRIYTLGDWLLCRKCYHLVIGRLESLTDILLGRQDEFKEWLASITLLRNKT